MGADVENAAWSSDRTAVTQRLFGLGNEEPRRDDVNIVHSAPHLCVREFEITVRYHLDNSGIVDEDVDAPVVIQDSLNQTGDAAFVSKIGSRVAGIPEFANQTHTRLM
jgi:hypothetical protein